MRANSGNPNRGRPNRNG